jgi:regulator of replication initiation timing
LVPITEMEIGAALQEINEVRHDHRNLRQIVTLISEEQDKMRMEQAKLKTRLTTILSVIVVAFTFVTSVLGLWKVQ